MFSRNRRTRRRNVETPGTLAPSLRALIDEHANVVFHIALGILHDRDLAEDVVQETMIKAWESSASFRGDSSVRTWISRIARNTAIDTLRRRRDSTTADGVLPDHGDASGTNDTERRAEDRADLRRLAEALRELDETSRTIMVLREVDSMSYQQIAETLEISVAVVKTRLLRARRGLQAAVRPEEVGK